MESGRNDRHIDPITRRNRDEELSMAVLRQMRIEDEILGRYVLENFPQDRVYGMAACVVKGAGLLTYGTYKLATAPSYDIHNMGNLGILQGTKSLGVGVLALTKRALRNL